MTTKHYTHSFKASLVMYTLQEEDDLCAYRKHRLTDHLAGFQVENWLRMAIAHPWRTHRIKAIRKLGQHASSTYEVDVLTRLYQHDPDLELRAAAQKAVMQIQARIK